MKTKINPSSRLRSAWKLSKTAARRFICMAVFHARAYALGFEIRHGLPILP